jgi:hypothetical protein
LFVVDKNPLIPFTAESSSSQHLNNKSVRVNEQKGDLDDPKIQTIAKRWSHVDPNRYLVTLPKSKKGEQK